MRPQRKKKQLVQVLNSVDFSDYDGCSESGQQSLQCGESMVDSEFLTNGPDELSTKGNFSDDRSWNKSCFSEFSQTNKSVEDL